MIYSKTGITFFRGDDDAMMIALKHIPFEPGDKVYFVLKDRPEDTTDVLRLLSTNFVEYNEIMNSAALININHAHTINLPLKTYHYTILIEWSNSTYVTVFPYSKFFLVPGGSHGTI